MTAAAAASELPLSGHALQSALELEDHPVPPGTPAYVAHDTVVTPGYPRLLGIPLLAGRGFADDEGSRREPTALVGAALARRFWPGQSAVGKHLRYVWEKRWRTIVGVVGDVRDEGLAKSAAWEIYLPFGQEMEPAMYVVLAVEGDPARSGAALRRAVAEMAPDVPVSRLRTLDGIVAASVGAERSTAWLLAALSGLALALAALGIYGVVSYSVARRTREIGVRMALGATVGDVRRLILGQALALALAGVALGSAAALAAARLVKSLLYGVSAADPLVFCAAPALLAAIALLAAYLPARRAVRLDPTAALREE